MSKVVFVGNVPYNYGEDQLIEVFKSVGQVVGFRLVFDRETGKPRGYGFCEFADHETAASAVRNLNNQDVGGRPLRIDLADSDPFLEGKTTVRGELLDGGVPGPTDPRHGYDYIGSSGSRGRSQDSNPNAFLSALPTGIQVPPGSTSLDMISQILGTMEPNKLMEVLAQMKAFVITHPEQARALLVAHPQFAYALFQGLLLTHIVDPAILNRMLKATSGVPAAPGPPPPAQHIQQHPPPSHHYPPPPLPQMTGLAPPHPMSAPPPSAMFSYQQQHQPQQQPPIPPPGYYRPPPAIPQAQPAPPPLPQVPQLDDNQRAALMKVLSLSQEEVNALPPTERDQIQVLRNQFLGGIKI